jgi:hypothetical protein
MEELFGGIDPPTHEIPRREFNVNGRKEHEAILKDHVKMKELGLDPYYETMVYLRKWGNWL